METTRHVFNVIFKMPRRSPTDYGEISNVHSFNVKPVYWTIAIIPGKGRVEGTVDLFCLGRDIVSASALFSACAVVRAIPKAVYSACAIISGCSMVSASPVEYPFETYMTSGSS